MSVPSSPPTLARQASGAMFWIASARLASQLFQVLVAAILTRLLSPEDFGVIAMVLVFSGFLAVISSAGISSAIVQFRDLEREDFGTVLSLSLIVGIGMTVLFAGLAHPIAHFYDLPAIAPVVLVMSASFTISASSRVSTGLLERDLAFRTLAWIRVSAAIFAGLVAVGAALLGASYWALIAQVICNEVATTILVFIAAGWRPRLAFDGRVVRRVVGFSGHLTLFNIVNYWARNFDNLLIGRVLGAAPLGFYNRGYALMLYPVSALTTVVTPVLHPLLSGLQDDIPRMTRAYLRIVRFVAMLAFPLMTGLGLLAPEVIQVVWGPGWERSEPVFRILCIVGAVQALIAATSSIFLARGRANLLFKIGTLNAAVVITGIAAGLPWGIEGVAAGYGIAACLTAIPTLYWVSTRLLDASPVDVLLVVAKPIALAIIVAIPLLVLNTLLYDNLSALGHLAVGVAVSLIIYPAALRIIAPHFLTEVYELLPDKAQDRLRWLIRRGRK